MKIRHVKLGDRDSVFRWLDEDDYIREVWEEWAKGPGFYGAEENGDLVGVLHVRWIEDIAWLEGVRIEPKHRRRGIATKLTEYVMAVSKLHGCRWAMLLISSHNTPSIRLAEKVGFRRVAEFSTFKSGLFPGKHVCRAASWVEARSLPGLNRNNYVVGNPEQPWSFIWLTEALLDRLAGNGMAFGVKGGLILIGKMGRWTDRLHISYLESDNARSLKTLLGCASSIALKRGLSELFGIVPRYGETARLLMELGVEVKADRALYVYAYDLLKYKLV